MTAIATRSERLTFPGAAGDRPAGRLERPAGPVRAYALFAHCFTCGKDVRAASVISRSLAREGIAVLRFDFTGLAWLRRLLGTGAAGGAVDG